MSKVDLKKILPDSIFWVTVADNIPESKAIKAWVSHGILYLRSDQKESPYSVGQAVSIDALSIGDDNYAIVSLIEKLSPHERAINEHIICLRDMSKIEILISNFLNIEH